MSAPVSRDPLVVNTQDGACWTRRAVTRDGRGLYALAEVAADVPVLVLARLSELAEHGLASMADALPMPVGPGPRTADVVEDELTGANLSLWEEEQTTARLRLALKSAQRGRRELRELLDSPPSPDELDARAARFEEWERLRARVSELETQRQADHETWQHDLRTARSEREASAARIAELEGERHSTNEALDDAVQALRARPVPDAARSADRLTRFFAPTQALREGGA